MSVTKAPARPVGPPARHPVIPGEEMGTAADISQFHALPRLDAKVFSLSGGDPAVNGLVTYFALFGGPSEGWSAYPLGDYAEWRVAEAKTGRVVLVVRQDTGGAGREYSEDEPNGADRLRPERRDAAGRDRRQHDANEAVTL